MLNKATTVTGVYIEDILKIFIGGQLLGDTEAKTIFDMDLNKTWPDWRSY